MNKTNETITAYDQLKVSDEWKEFRFDIPVTVCHSPGQKGQYGVPLEPDTYDVDVSGNIRIKDTDTGETLSEKEFVEQYDGAESLLNEMTHPDNLWEWLE